MSEGLHEYLGHGLQTNMNLASTREFMNDFLRQAHARIQERSRKKSAVQ